MTDGSAGPTGPTGPTGPDIATASSLPMGRPATLLLPPPEAEERLAITKSDYNRVRNAVKALTDPRIRASEWAGTSVGAFFAFLIAFLTEDHPARHAYPMRKAVFGMLALLTLILAIFMIWTEYVERGKRGLGKSAVVADMDTIEREAPRLVTETTERIEQ